MNIEIIINLMSRNSSQVTIMSQYQLPKLLQLQ